MAGDWISTISGRECIISYLQLQLIFHAQFCLIGCFQYQESWYQNLEAGFSSESFDELCAEMILKSRIYDDEILVQIIR